MSDAILTLNAGSSSIKFALFALPRRDCRSKPELVGQIDGIGAAGRSPRTSRSRTPGRECWTTATSTSTARRKPRTRPLRLLVDGCTATKRAGAIAGVGHRVVHGAQKFLGTDPARCRGGRQLRGFIPAGAPAPAAQPGRHRRAGTALPGVPQVACFDTAFHRSQPEVRRCSRCRAPSPPRACGATASTACPTSTSPTCCRNVCPGTQADGRVIVAHLGNGASMCAMTALKSQATTMGFTAVDGLMMGTRTGSLDPGVLLYLMDYQKHGRQGADPLLYKESGLLGVSGISQDMRVLLESERPRRARRSTCSATASCARSARWPPRWADSTPWCSPAASANGARRYGGFVPATRMARFAARRGSNSSNAPKISARTAARTSRFCNPLFLLRQKFSSFHESEPGLCFGARLNLKSDLAFGRDHDYDNK
jgi:acetate kinase